MAQKLLFPFLFLLLSLLHPNTFAVGERSEKALRPVNIGRQEYETNTWVPWVSWVPRVTWVTWVPWVPWVTWVPIDKTMTEDNEFVEAEVLVLGAGMAGITVAARLKEEGVEGVVVVEGSDRIGGRVKDTQFGGITIELGANWVHRLVCQS